MIEWEDLAYATAERFGGTIPHPDTANVIASVYARAPHAVLRAIDRVADDYDNGTIRSPWGVLKTRVQQITVDQKGAAKSTGREKAIERAEQRMRNELLHYDRWPEVEDELFGDRGTLREHDNPTLRQRMETLWTDLRPLGELVEHEAIQRGLLHQEQRARLAAKKPEPAPDAGNLEVKDGIQVTT